MTYSQFLQEKINNNEIRTGAMSVVDMRQAYKEWTSLKN